MADSENVDLRLETGCVVHRRLIRQRLCLPNEALSELLTLFLGDAPAQAGCSDSLGLRETNTILAVRRKASLHRVLVVTPAVNNSRDARGSGQVFLTAIY